VKVLAVDPGLTRCGIAVVEQRGNVISMVEVNTLLTDKDLPLDQRLACLHQQIHEWLTRHNPDVVAIERVFSQQNVRTAMGTAQAAAVAMLGASHLSIPVVHHTPSEVKAAVTGSGRADKKQVSSMVVKILNLVEVPKPVDSTDALALAICHIWRGSAQNKIGKAIVKSANARKITQITTRTPQKSSKKVTSPQKLSKKTIKKISEIKVTSVRKSVPAKRKEVQ
jgi:crossover junction endodeoxyribonuclease RuvC